MDHPILHAQQEASLDHVYYRPYTARATRALEVALPDTAEVERFRRSREGVGSGALDLLDEFYGTRDNLKALAVRDRDGDDTPDYRVSDYYGKLSEAEEKEVVGFEPRFVFSVNEFSALRLPFTVLVEKCRSTN